MTNTIQELIELGEKAIGGVWEDYCDMGMSAHADYKIGEQEWGMKILDIRGWGHLTGKGHARRLELEEAKQIQQDNLNFLIAAANSRQAIKDMAATNSQLQDLIDSQLQTIDALKKRLEGLKDMAAVDVESLKMDASMIGVLYSNGDTDEVNRIEGYNQAIDHINKRGLISPLPPIEGLGELVDKLKVTDYLSGTSLTPDEVAIALQASKAYEKAAGGGV